MPRLRGGDYPSSSLSVDRRYELHFAMGTGVHHRPSNGCWQSWISKVSLCLFRVFVVIVSGTAWRRYSIINRFSVDLTKVEAVVSNVACLVVVLNFLLSFQFPSRSKRIDVMSRILFPVVFAVFNLAYWGTYLFRENEDE